MRGCSESAAYVVTVPLSHPVDHEQAFIDASLTGSSGRDATRRGGRSESATDRQVMDAPPSASTAALRACGEVPRDRCVRSGSFLAVRRIHPTEPMALLVDAGVITV